MTQADRKKAAVLGVLVLTLAGYWGYGYFAGRPEAKPPAAAERKEAAKAPAGIPAPPGVDIGLLDVPREGYTESSRNMFAPVYRKPELTKPAAPKAPITVQPALPPQPPPPPPPPPKSAEELAREAALADMAKFKVMGFLKRKGKTDVFLTFEGGAYVVSQGDLIAKDYYLSEVGKDQVVISSKDTGATVKLKADFEGAGKSSQPSAAPADAKAPAGQGRKKPPAPAPSNRPGGPAGAGRRPAGMPAGPADTPLDDLPPLPEPGPAGAGANTYNGGTTVPVPKGLGGRSVKGRR